MTETHQPIEVKVKVPPDRVPTFNAFLASQNRGSRRDGASYLFLLGLKTWGDGNAPEMDVRAATAPHSAPHPPAPSPGGDGGDGGGGEGVRS